MGLGAVVVVAVAGLVAWRWWLAHAQWVQTHRNVERDATVSRFDARLAELEDKARSWRK